MFGHFPFMRYSTVAALMLLTSGHFNSAKAEFNIRNVASGLVLDIVGALPNDFQTVTLFRSNGGKNQLFDEAVETDESFSLVAQHTGNTCLDVVGFGTQDGVSVVQFRCHFGANQRWTAQRMGNGVILRSVNSGKCLDADNGNFPTPPPAEARLQQWTCISDPHDANSVNQIFRLGGF